MLKKIFFGYFYPAYQNFFRFVLQKLRKKRNILLHCNSKAMEEHLLDYYQQFKGNKDLAFFLYTNFTIDSFSRCIRQKKQLYCLTKEASIHHVKNKLSLYFTIWDLIICPDAGVPFYAKNRIIPTLYINHGMHIISHDNGETLYAYGNKEKKINNLEQFSIMLEPNIRIAKIMQKENPLYKNVVRFTSYKFAENIVSNIYNKNLYKQQLRIEPQKTLVCIFGTWGKNSLFHVLGKKLIDLAKLLQKKDFVFMLSIHPNEYIHYDENIEPLGAFIEAQRKHGFLVRSIGEDFIPYLIASDIVICDHSTFYELALLAEKKLILSEFPDEIVWKQSIAFHAKRELPILCNADNLEDILIQVKEQPLNDRIRKYSQEIYSEKGFYHQEVVAITMELLYEK